MLNAALMEELVLLAADAAITLLLRIAGDPLSLPRSNEDLVWF